MSLAAVIDADENFNFKPYVYVSNGIHLAQLFKETSSEVMLVPRSLAPAKAQLFIGVIAPMLLPFILKSEKGVMFIIINR